MFYSYTPNITFTGDNGSYPIALHQVGSFLPAKISGPLRPSQTQVNVSGPERFTVRFGSVENLTFNETGLPLSAGWSVRVAGPVGGGGIVPASIEKQVWSGGGFTPAMAYDDRLGEVFLGGYLHGSLGAVDVVNASTGEMLTEVPLALGPASSLSYLRGLDQVIAAGGPHSSYVAWLSGVTDKVVHTLTLGGPVMSVAFDSQPGDLAAGDLLVVNSTWGLVPNPFHLTVINATNYSIVAEIPISPSSGAIYAPGIDRIFFTESGGIGSWYGTNLSNATFTPLTNISSVLYDPGKGSLFVSQVNLSGGYVTVLNASNGTPVTTIPLFAGSTYLGLAYLPSRGEVVVADPFNGILAVLNDTKNVYVTSFAGYQGVSVLAYFGSPNQVLGLAPAGELYLAGVGAGERLLLLNNSGLSDSGTQITFQVPVGAALQFTVTTSSPLLRWMPRHGSLVVPDRNISRTVRFSLITALISFRESGLPPSTIWSVAITSGSTYPLEFPQTVYRNSSLGPIRFRLPVGVYNYTVSDFGPSIPVVPTGNVTVITAPVPGQVVVVSFT